MERERRPTFESIGSGSKSSGEVGIEVVRACSLFRLRQVFALFTEALSADGAKIYNHTSAQLSARPQYLWPPYCRHCEDGPISLKQFGL
jgi:hypothetical protein